MRPMVPELSRGEIGPVGRAAVEEFRARGGTSHDAACRIVALLAEHAPALLPLALGDVSLPDDVLSLGLAHHPHVGALVRSFRGASEGLVDGPELRRTLRRLRHRHVVRIALREILRLEDVDRTAGEMSALAAAACEVALESARRTVEARHGAATITGTGTPVPLTCLGMGKLGGWELNLGSDVDLCFFYETDDAQVEDPETTVHEVYAKVVSRACKILADVTEDGLCFRVDLRLRPEGTQGPLVNSLASTERYYESFGRAWERAALLRARPIAGDREFGRRLLDALAPFVFRRAVDPSIAGEMAAMLERSRRELEVDETRDVKLGRGGIREAEFFVQTLQLVWGGRHPQLRTPGTMQALRRLAGAGLVKDSEVRALSSAWAHLRRIEHRIHVWSGYQTHQLPPSGEERERFARSLGMKDAAALEARMRRDRAVVAELFDSLRAGEAQPPSRERALCDRIAQGADREEVARALAELLPVHDESEAAHHVLRLARHAEDPLGPVGRERTPELGPRLLSEVAATADPERALRFVADFFARLRGWDYARLLESDTRLLRRLVGLFGTSATLSTALVGHPEELDALLVAGAIDAREVDVAHHELRPLALGDDPEALASAMRRAKRACTLRTGLGLVSGELTLGDAEHVLSRVAVRQIELALCMASRLGEARWGRASGGASMVVCAMGKLGGGELGFGGDLDLVFLYDEDGETEPTPKGRSTSHAELFTRVAQQTMRLLSQPDAEGPGYDTDTRLRPSGAQGTLVVSLAAFDRYHAERSAAWERQALVRATPIAGDPALCARVLERILEVAIRGEAPSGAEVAAMRARMQRELAGESKERWHPKLGHGGLVDVEFVAQLCAMRSHDPAMRGPATMDSLAALASAGHLAREDADALSGGYAFLRGIEQTLKLLDETREPALRPGSRTAEQVARRLGIGERDALDPASVLAATYRRHADEIRGIFERVVGPIDAPCPWRSPEEGAGDVSPERVTGEPPREERG